MSAPYIGDGYTESGYVAPIGNVPAIRFTYRPTTRHTLNVYLEKIAGKKEVAIGMLEAIELASRIVEWNIADEHGAPWPVSAENLLKLRPPHYNAIVRVVIYGSPSDADPDAPTPDDAEIKRLMETMGGVEASQKN